MDLRKIIFRAKTLNKGEWVQSMTIANGTIERKKHNLYMEVGNDKWKGVDPNTLGQYTGVDDKNGKRIFEGDILKFDDVCCEVGWNPMQSAFCIRFSFETRLGLRTLGSWLVEKRNAVVVGNIHDSPELLDEKTSK